MVKLPFRRLRRAANGMTPRGGRHVDARESLVAQVGPAAVPRGGPCRAPRDPAADRRYPQGGGDPAAFGAADRWGSAAPAPCDHRASTPPRGWRGDGHNRRHLSGARHGVCPAQDRPADPPRGLAAPMVLRRPERGQWEGAADGAGSRDRSRRRPSVSRSRGWPIALVLPGLTALLSAVPAEGQRADTTRSTEPILLRPARVFDGVANQAREGWVVRVQGDRIAAVGPAADVSATGARVIDLPGMTLLPGLIDAHSHLLLHPYDETSWDDQVLREPLALRVARATVHARATLLAGFTTLRDLGTEGAGWADVGLKQAITRGVIPGPRLLIATKAIVATGSYGPKGFATEVDVPQGAEEADGADLVRVVRDQI